MGTRHRGGDLAERNVVPRRIQRVGKAHLLVGGLGDFQAGGDQIRRFAGVQGKAEAVGVDDHKTVAAIGGVDLHRPPAFDFDGRVQLVGVGRHVAHFDAHRLAIAALGDHLDQAAGGFENQAGLGFGHRHNAGVQQHRGDAHRVGAGHRWHVGRLHDDEAHLRLRVLWRHQQIDVAKHPPAWFVEHKVAQHVVIGNPARLFPQRIAGRRCDAADDHVADFAFRMATDDMDDFR